MAQVGEHVVDITERHDDQGCHVALRGRLDVHTVADLRLTMHRVVAGGSTALLLDLSQAQVGDATGFGFLVETSRRSLRAGRDLRVVACEERTARLLRRARLGGLLRPPTVTAARPASAMATAAG